MSIANKVIDVFGDEMAYYEHGVGQPVVFLHGNPTSSYLWRNIVPMVNKHYRCIAPDLIGMGKSDKLSTGKSREYTLATHQHYLDGFLDAVLPEECVTLVVHDWGSALGFDWASRHEDRVTGIAYMEAIVAPLIWDDFPEEARTAFQALRSPAGEGMVLDDNLFVEQILPGAVLRTLSEQEMDEYRRPYSKPGEGRRPTLTWPRQLPIDGEPLDTQVRVANYGDWLQTTEIPKLFINAEPGGMLTGRLRQRCRAFRNQTEVCVPGIHFIQEDSSPQIAEEILGWLGKVSSV